MVEKLKFYFTQKNMQEIAAGEPGISAYYDQDADIAKILLLIDCEENRSLTAEDIRDLKERAVRTFLDAGIENMEFLFLFAGYDVEKMKTLFMEEDINWVFDLAGRGLMLFETQKTDFLGLQEGILKLTERKYAGTFAFKKLGSYLITGNGIIILFNLIVFAVCEWMAYAEDSHILYEYGAAGWEYLGRGEFYRLLTSMFLHADIQHIFNNMLLLFYLGSYLEKILGRMKYILLYVLSGILADLVSMGYNYAIKEPAVSVGASGAVFGVSGALAYIILVHKGKAANIGRRQILIFLVLSIYGGLARSGVDNAAHIGGLAAGFLIAMVLYLLEKGADSR